jgi:hypothetical protein
VSQQIVFDFVGEQQHPSARCEQRTPVGEQLRGFDSEAFRMRSCARARETGMTYVTEQVCARNARSPDISSTSSGSSGEWKKWNSAHGMNSGE